MARYMLVVSSGVAQDECERIYMQLLFHTLGSTHVS